MIILNMLVTSFNCDLSDNDEKDSFYGKAFNLYVCTDSPQTCERERASLLRSAWLEERFIPECTADGRYSPAQCHAATGYCWCVRVDSGRPLPGTSAR